MGTLGGNGLSRLFTHAILEFFIIRPFLIKFVHKMKKVFFLFMPLFLIFPESAIYNCIIYIYIHIYIYKLLLFPSSSAASPTKNWDLKISYMRTLFEYIQSKKLKILTDFIQMTPLKITGEERLSWVAMCCK